MSIILATVHVEKSPTAFPLAAAVLKTTMESDSSFSKTETRVKLMDFYLSDKPETIAGSLLSASPEAVGFSVYTWNAETIIETAGLLKKRKPELLIFAGGPQVTAAAEQFSTPGFFDLLVTGEGEAVLPETLHSLLKTGGFSGPLISSPVPFDFGNSPSPYSSVLTKRGEYKGILWEVARGRAFPWFMTVTRALEIPASELFYRYAEWKIKRPSGSSSDAVYFITAQLREIGKTSLIPVLKSFITWSRTAEAAFMNPGKTCQVSLCRKPEVLDKLAGMDAETFLVKYPAGKTRNYRIVFDGNELYLS